jgi:predicted DNA-binding transcriptional regulator YafY
MRTGDIVVIIYQDKRGQFSKRRIRITSVSDHYIRAYCFSRHQIRTFSRERVFSALKVIPA